MSGVDLLGAYVVADSTIGAGALIGAGLTAGSLAGLGIAAGSGAGADFYGYNGSTNGFTDLNSFNQAINNGANVNTNPAGAQFASQQQYNSVYQSAVNSGINPTQAAQYAQASTGFDGSAGVGGNLGGLGTATAPGAGVSTVAPVTATGGGAAVAGGSGLGGALLGAGVGAGVGLGVGALTGGSSDPIGTSNSVTSGPANAGTSGGTPPAGGTGNTGGSNSTLASGIAATGSVLGGLGSIAKGLSGGGTSVSAPNPATVAGGILQDEIGFAPAILQATQQNAPAYQQLQSGLLNASTSSVASGYSSLAPQLQGLQTGLNAQQAGGNLGLLGQYGSSFTQQYLASNPQLQQTQNTLNNLANTQQNPVGAITGAGSQLNGVGSEAINSVNQNSVQQQMNPTLGMLNQTAQQQLALGTSMSPQESATVANQVLSNYNSMGRAEDPTAIAGLATGLDTYGQQLLQQREGAASTAAGQLTTAQTANQQAQATNLSAQLGAQGLNYEALSGQGAQGLTGAQSNQQAQLSNATYQAGLLQNAASLEQSSAAPAMQTLLGQSQGLTNAYNTTAQGGTSLSNANALSGMYNPFNSAAYGPAYSAQSNANLTNATTNAGLIGGGLSMLGNLATSSSFMSSLSGLFG